MRLTESQTETLATLLAPRLGTGEQRRKLLRRTFPNDPMLIRIADRSGLSGKQFALELMTALASARSVSGTPALDKLFTGLVREAQVNDPSFAQALTAVLGSSGSAEMADAVAPAEAPPVLAAPAPDEDSEPPADEPAPAHRKRRRRRARTPYQKFVRSLRKTFRWRVVVAILIVLITLPTVIALVLIADSVSRVRESVNSLSRVSDQLVSRPFADLRLPDLQRAQRAVADVTAALDNAGRNLRLIGPLEALSPDLAAGSRLLTAAQSVSRAAERIFQGLEPTLFFMLGDEDQPSTPSRLSAGERIIELLRLGQGQFIEASGYLDDAETALQRLDLNGVSSGLLLYSRDVREYYDLFRTLNEALLDSPDLLATAFGMNTPQNYLILSQNNDEIRPSGGYISTWGWARIRRFQIAEYGYSATTATSPTPPSDALAADLRVPSWWIEYDRPIFIAWDASWYANYDSTAQMAAWFYDNGGNPNAPVDGVIGINILGFQYLLEALGSVTMPDGQTVITPENFRTLIYEVRAEAVTGQSGVTHKAYLAEVFQQIMGAWQAADQEASNKLLSGFLRGLREKQIMLYFREKRLNDLVRVLGWAGTQDPEAGHDYLMVADANWGNKSNHSIARRLTYDVRLQPDGSANSQLAISYDYPASVAERDPAVRPEHYGNQRDYYNVMQVFVPPGARLNTTDNLSRPLSTENGETLTTFITDVEVRYDSTERFSFNYDTPVVVDRIGSYQRYRLRLQKQSGMTGESVTVTITLPERARMIDVAPEPITTYDLETITLEFRLALTTDTWIEIIYE